MTRECHVRFCERPGVQLPRPTHLRNLHYAQAYCRISSYLQTMAYRGYNPLVAIQLALSGQLYAQTGE
jgi:hypothetical protein